MQTTQHTPSSTFPQAELARHMSEQPIAALRGESADAAELERVVELGYN